MAMGKRRDVQEELFVSTASLQSPGHPFYEALSRLLDDNGFDRVVEEACAPFYAESRGRRSIPPGVYFRMLFVGYFEGIESERALCWRCADSLSLRQFLGLGMHESVLDHSSLSVIRGRLAPHVFDEVFHFVLDLVSSEGLLRGREVGIDSSLMEANASMRSLTRRDDGSSYHEYIRKITAESTGDPTPTSGDVRRADRKRKGKRVSNREWEAKADPDARITRMKNGSTRLAYKPEHAVDLETGVVLAATLNRADQSDHQTLLETLDELEGNLEHLDRELDSPCLVADKGYHSDGVFERCEQDGFTSYIAEPRHPQKRNWKNKTDGDERRRRLYGNRRRLRGNRSRKLMRKRRCENERSFAHVMQRGGWKRTHLRGRENNWKPYLVQVAAHNLSVLLRNVLGAGTPKALRAALGSSIAMSARFSATIMRACGWKGRRRAPKATATIHEPHRTSSQNSIRRRYSTAC